MMIPLELFKVIPVKRAKYDDSQVELSLDDKIRQLAQHTQRKVKKLIASLENSGYSLDKSGYIRGGSLQDSVLPYLLYAIKGRDKPSDWTTFASILASCKLPKDILSARASLDVRRARRNAKESSSD